MRDGLFLVRSSRKSGDFMLMLCHDSAPHSYRIRVVSSVSLDLYQAGDEFTLDNIQYFSSLSKLVDYYRSGEVCVSELTARPRP